VTDDVISHANNSLWQLRADAWSSLEEASERLADGVALGRRGEQLTGQAGALFALLDPIESYWAFPGGHRFERARRLFDAGDFTRLTRLARLVAAINQALVTDSYRSGVPWRVAEGEDDGDDRKLTTEEPRRRARTSRC